MKNYEPIGFAAQIFKDRYAIHSEETFEQACKRVADYIANAEQGVKRDEYSKRFLEILNTNRFSAGGRIWRGAGQRKAACINCFVLPVFDSREDWGELLKNVTIISGLGGGIGISFAEIRPRGTPIRGTGGIATGSVSLMKMVNSICNELREGGGRRSALLYGLPYNHPDIEEFLHVKLDEKELNNANISVLIDNKFLDLVKKDKEISLDWAGQQIKTIKAKWIYDKVIKHSLQTGDPGFLNMGFAEEMNNLHYCRSLAVSNPCIPNSVSMLTDDGIKQLKDLDIGDTIWSENGWTKILNIIPQGKKKIYKFKTTAGSVICTPNHKIISDGIKIPIEQSDSIDILLGVINTHDIQHNIQDIMDGLMIGDGTRHKASEKIYLNIGIKDQDYFQSEISKLIHNQCNWKEYYYEIQTTIQLHELPLTYLRTIPDRFLYGQKEKICSFLRGLYSANGSICDGRITLKASSFAIIEKTQLLLSSLGIQSYYTTNKSKNVQFDKGNYKCRQSYDLNITQDRHLFVKYIGFLQKYKNKKLQPYLSRQIRKPRKINFNIKNIEYIGEENVFDITVSNEQHTFWCDGFNMANCGEQLLPPMSICCLGNIVLPTHITSDGEIDWGLLDDTIRLSVRFLDNVLDVNEFPFKEIKDISENERRIGLGVMGLHDMLIRMGIKYSSDEALKIIDKLMSFIKKKAYEASIFLAVEKGQFPFLDRQQFIESGFCKKSLTPSIRKKILEYGIRNCCVLTCPPTGTTSIVAGVSSGIEPIFAPVYKRNFNKHKDIHSNMTNQSQEIVIHPLLKEFYLEKKNIDNFEGSYDITPEQHCKVQTICQKHIDSGVSKTINLPTETTEIELSDIILTYLPNLKGLTIYKEGSKGNSPLMPISIKHIDKYIKKDHITEILDSDCPKGSCDI